jgi:hypothetical protein
MSSEKRQGKGPKKLVSIPEELLKRVTEISEKEGKNFNRYIEECLWQAIRVKEKGRTLEEVVSFFEILQTQRASGATFTPLNVFDYLTSKIKASEKDELRSIWYESGRWYGTYISEKFENPVQALTEFLKATRWDVNEINLRMSENEIRFTCISTTMTEADTSYLSKFIEGAINKIGYDTEKSDLVRGMIAIQFKRS